MQELKNCLGLRIKNRSGPGGSFCLRDAPGKRQALPEAARSIAADREGVFPIRVIDCTGQYSRTVKINTCKSNTLCMGKFGQSRQFQHIEGVFDRKQEYFDTTTTIYKYTLK